MKFEAKGRKFAKNFEITRAIYSCIERSEQFLVSECFFLTCSWKFLRSNKLEQSEFKLENIIGIYKHAGKVRKRLTICGRRTEEFASKSNVGKKLLFLFKISYKFIPCTTYGSSYGGMSQMFNNNNCIGLTTTSSSQKYTSLSLLT